MALLVLHMVIGGLIGCSGDNSGTAPVSSATAYFAVSLNQHAINMALTSPPNTTPSNTIQLVATALNANGDPLLGPNHVTFSATDSSVTVTPTGLVTAHYTTSSNGTAVIATVQRDRLTLADTAFIRVTQTPPPAPISTFSIQPEVGDSAVRSFGSQYTPTISATDVNGQAMPFSTQDVSANLYWLASSRLVVAHIDRSLPYLFALTDTGHVTLYATSWVYGVPVQDSLRFVVGWPLQQYMVAYDSPQAMQKTFFLGVGGTFMVYYEPSTDTASLDIIFDNPTPIDSALDTYYHVYSGAGNFHFGPLNPMDSVGVEARRFPVAGTYPYHSRSDPTAAGTIFVLENPR